MRISDWISVWCSSDRSAVQRTHHTHQPQAVAWGERQRARWRSGRASEQTPLESQCCFGADVEAVVQRQYHRKGLSRFDGADNEMNITAWVGQYDSGSAAALCVHVGEAQVELFEPAGHPKHGRCGFKQQQDRKNTRLNSSH